MSNECVLAMYDVRGKQEYIYRSNRIKEIVGGSCIIRDVFRDYLYPAARVARNEENDRGEEDAICSDKDDKGEIRPFSVKEFEKRMEGDQYIGEIVYEGGGNLFVLYKNKEICIKVNRIFTRDLLVHTYTLKVLCTYIEGVDFQNYVEDNRKLREQHRINESQESMIYPVNSLPIVKVDNRTSRPLSLSRRRTPMEKSEEMSKEDSAKYDKYEKEAEQRKEEIGEKVLDRIVTKKGEESLLAVIYIDGNNMGAKVSQRLAGKDSYEKCVNELRQFSQKIQKEYVDDRLLEINDRLDRKYKDKKRRMIVAAGDELTIICNARDALDVVEAYFEGMRKNNSENNGSCAGIAIFHSHAPFSEAYRIAEECCETGKKRMREDRLSNADFVDFHYCQSGIGFSLEAIREMEGTKMLSRPWRADEESAHEKFYYTINMAKKMGSLLRKAKRSNVKSLLEYAKDSPAKLMMELKRINAHRDEPLDFLIEDSRKKKMNEQQMQKLLYDVILVYDLWFAEEEKPDAQESRIED